LRLLKLSVFLLMALCSAGWLRADIPDPTIRLSIPGGGSVDIVCTTDGCSTDVGTIAADGFSNADPTDPAFPGFSIKNANPDGLDINELIFHFQTNNVFQPFSAFANDFTTVHISVDQNVEGFGGTVNVDYSGIAVDGTPGSDFLAAPVCDFGEFCPTQIGFAPGSTVTVQSFFGDPIPDPGCCDGFLNGEHAALLLSTDVPEPESFMLLLGAAGLLAIKRKSKFHRT
jgi:hypothetical protein